MSDPFIAEVKIFAGNFAPRGWAFCNGQLLPIAQNTALFSLIGTIYGGDGRTTTALPNLRGRAPMHPGRGPGLTARTIGQRGGTETETLTLAQIPNHTHQAKGSGPANSNEPTNGGHATNPMVRQYHAPENLVDMAGASLGNTGGGQAHNNLQPYLVINFIIALTGTFPSRS